MVELTAEERASLIEGLAALIERWGPERYLTAPLLEPTDAFFPDPYTPDLRGLRTVARRLLRYASLGALDVNLTRGEETLSEPGLETLVSLTNVDPDAVDLTMWAQGPPDDVPLKLAHEVARAYEWLRAEYGRGESYRDAALEDEGLAEDYEEQVSLTAHYLGFGLLAAMGAHQYRASGGLEGLHAVTRWVHRSVGALGPEASCFVLAISATVRNIEEPVLRGWKAHLGVNQTRDFSRFRKQLRTERAALIEQLGLPDPAAWPEPEPLDPAPLEDDGWSPAVPLFSLEEPVFRREQHQGWRAVSLTTGAGVVAFVAALVNDRSDPIVATMVGGPVASALAYFVGKRFAKPDVCSRCEAVAPADLERCAGCGNRFLGTIGETESALAAEERLEGFSAFGALQLEPQADADPRYVELGCKCPQCAWIPDGEAHWECSECDVELFNTFEHGGQCPACEFTFEETLCPSCDHISPYDWWWPA